jgi:16S rRNA (uracil1498-N3)-methyltransferase
MRRFFISPEQIGSQQASLSGDQARHAVSVLRLRPGDPVVVFDGSGQEYEARIASLSNQQVNLDILHARTGCAESLLDLVMAQGYLKDKKMDRLVRQLTELGVTRWVPFLAQRSVPQPDAQRQSRRHQRWQKLSLEALKQCRRSRPMQIEPLASFQEMVAMAQAYEHKWVFYEKAEQTVNWPALQMPRPARLFVLIGPEGGFAAEEIAVAQSHGFKPLGLGPRILRADTAALAVCAIVQAVVGDMGGQAANPEKSP